MRKYWFLFKAYLSTTLEYRTVPIVWALIELLILASGIFLWLAIYRQETSVAGYDFQQMIFYYMLIPLIGSLTQVHVSGSLPHHIKDGRISTSLLKPYNLPAKYFFRSVSIVVLQQIIKLPIFLLALGFLLKLFQIGIDLRNIILALFICLFAFVLHFFLDLCLSLAAFWMDNVWALRHLKLVVLMVFGGMVFPLKILPQGLLTIFSFLPFQFFYFFPISIAQGVLSGGEIITGLFKIGFWLLAFYLLAQVLWRQGMKRYGAYGG